jgi:hypothetical protein
LRLELRQTLKERASGTVSQSTRIGVVSVPEQGPTPQAPPRVLGARGGVVDAHAFERRAASSRLAEAAVRVPEHRPVERGEPVAKTR